MGISTEEAFQRFADRTGSPDAQDVAAAISMQMRVGGSEAKIMESIATNIQDRIMLRKEIQSVFAEMDVVIRIYGFRAADWPFYHVRHSAGIYADVF